MGRDVPSLWMPMTDQLKLAVLGKLAEEVNELGAIIARCIIQGIDGFDPDTGEANILALEKECADVRGLTRLTVETFDLNSERLQERANQKYQHKKLWNDMIRAELERRAAARS